MSTSSTHFWGRRWFLEFISDSILYLLLFIILFNLSLRMSVGKSIKEGKAKIVVKFYPCGFVLLNSISHWSARREKYRLVTGVMWCQPAWLDLGTLRFIVILFYCVKKWMLVQHAVMPHKSGQCWWNYKTTDRDFMTLVIYDPALPPLPLLCCRYCWGGRVTLISPVFHSDRLNWS